MLEGGGEGSVCAPSLVTYNWYATIQHELALRRKKVPVDMTQLSTVKTLNNNLPLMMIYFLTYLKSIAIAGSKPMILT